jgi:hypothetical protein
MDNPLKKRKLAKLCTIAAKTSHNNAQLKGGPDKTGMDTWCSRFNAVRKLNNGVLAGD